MTFRRLRSGSFSVVGGSIAASEAIGIGDEPRDIEAAHRIGIAAGAVAWGYAKPDSLRARSPDVFFETVAAVAATLAP